MKRWIPLLLLTACLLSSCSSSGERIKEPVSFYYLQSEYQYGTQGSVIAWEDREASGHRNDLLYLIKLYMMGPTSDELVSPLPRGTQVFSVTQEDTLLTLQISDTGDHLTDVEFSLAGACLSMTCFDLTDAQRITIVSGERSIIFTQDSLQLYDSIPSATEDTK